MSMDITVFEIQYIELLIIIVHVKLHKFTPLDLYWLKVIGETKSFLPLENNNFIFSLS